MSMGNVHGLLCPTLVRTATRWLGWYCNGSVITRELHQNCILILPPNIKKHCLSAMWRNSIHIITKCTVFSWTNDELIFLFAFVFELKEAWFKPYWAIHELPNNLVNESTQRSQRSQLFTTDMSTISASGSNNNHTGLGCLQSILTVDKAKQTSVKGTSPLV